MGLSLNASMTMASDTRRGERSRLLSLCLGRDCETSQGHWCPGHTRGAITSSCSSPATTMASRSHRRWRPRSPRSTGVVGCGGGGGGGSWWFDGRSWLLYSSLQACRCRSEISETRATRHPTKSTPPTSFCRVDRNEEGLCLPRASDGGKRNSPFIDFTLYVARSCFPFLVPTAHAHFVSLFKPPYDRIDFPTSTLLCMSLPGCNDVLINNTSLHYQQYLKIFNIRRDTFS